MAFPAIVTPIPCKAHTYPPTHLGADQFDDADPQDRREKESFWNSFYLVINLGSLFAVTVVVYVQEAVGWGVGFAIPAAAMLMAIVMFVSGTSLYSHVPPTER